MQIRINNKKKRKKTTQRLKWGYIYTVGQKKKLNKQND